MAVLVAWFAFNFTGIQQVSNPNGEGEYAIQFTKDLQFGGDLDAGEEYLWIDRFRPSTFEIGPNGHFYILDASNSRLLEFDDKGAYVGVFAKQGEGPGEYQGLTNFQILADGSAIGMDALRGTRKATYYDKDLKVIESKVVGSLTAIPINPYFSPDGSLFYSVLFSVQLREKQAPLRHYKSGIANASFEPVRILCASPWPGFDQSKVSNKGYWADYIGEQFDILINKTTGYATFLSTGEVLIFDAKKYEIEKWSKDLKTQIATITKEYTPVFFDDEEKAALAGSLEKTVFDQGLQNFVDESVLENALEKANLPLKVNPIVGIVPMEDGKFFVVTRANFDDGSVAGDFFDVDGHFMGKLSFPGIGLYELNTPMNASVRLVFRNGFAYAMSRNEDGDNIMLRYKYSITKK